jgi:hypothetical protein
VKRHEIRGDPGPSGVAPLTSATARRAVSVTAAWKSSKRSQVIAVSNVSLITPIATKVSRR